MTRLNVAAGILRDATGRVLIAERVGDGPFHGMWEFPGGKIGADETAEQALVRELGEELGIVVRDAGHFMYLEHDYPDRSVSIEFFLIEDWDRHPAGLEGQALAWVQPSHLPQHDLLPADEPVVAALMRL